MLWREHGCGVDYFETTTRLRFGGPLDERTNSTMTHLLPRADTLSTLPPICDATLAARALQEAA